MQLLPWLYKAICQNIPAWFSEGYAMLGCVDGGVGPFALRQQASPCLGPCNLAMACVTVLHTQVAFKGYEEARVALTCLLFTMPCCIIIGVEYGVFMNGELKRVSSRALPTCSWSNS